MSAASSNGTCSWRYTPANGTDPGYWTVVADNCNSGYSCLGPDPGGTMMKQVGNMPHKVVHKDFDSMVRAKYKKAGKLVSTVQDAQLSSPSNKNADFVMECT